MIDKFMTKINFNGPVLNEYLGRCWIWTDRTDEFGYGRFKVKGKSYQAHRWIAGYIAERQLSWKPGNRETVNHSCHNRCCIRPSHWYIGTQKTNVADSISAGTHKNAMAQKEKASKDHCVNGHKKTSTNTYTHKDGKTTCRNCQSDAQARYRLRQMSR